MHHGISTSSSSSSSSNSITVIHPTPFIPPTPELLKLFCYPLQLSFRLLCSQPSLFKLLLSPQHLLLQFPSCMRGQELSQSADSSPNFEQSRSNPDVRMIQQHLHRDLITPRHSHVQGRTALTIREVRVRLRMLKNIEGLFSTSK